MVRRRIEELFVGSLCRAAVLRQALHVHQLRDGARRAEAADETSILVGISSVLSVRWPRERLVDVRAHRTRLSDEESKKRDGDRAQANRSPSRLHRLTPPGQTTSCNVRSRPI